MRHPDTQYLPIDAVSDFVSNVDTADLSSGLGLKTRGLRHIKQGSIGERDFGTIWREKQFPTGISIVSSFPLYIPSEDKEYTIVVGTDSANNLRIYVDNATAEGTWTELTGKYTTTINAAVGATVFAVTITSPVQDILGANVTLTNDQVKYWVIKNTTRNNFAIITTNTATVLTCDNVYLGSSGLGWVNGDSLSLYAMTGIMDGYVFANGATPHVRWIPQEQLNKVTMLYGTGGSTITPQRPITIRKSVFSIPNASLANTNIGTTSGWYIDHMQTTCVFGSDGTNLLPRNVSSGDWSNTIGEGMQIAATGVTEDVVTTAAVAQKYYVTAIYRGTTAGSFYEESDPFYQCFLDPTIAGRVPKFTMVIGFDLAQIPKNLCGFRVYEASKLATDFLSDHNNWPDNSNDYSLITQFIFDTNSLTDLNGWALTVQNNTPYSYRFSKLISPAVYSKDALTVQTPFGLLVLAPVGRTTTVTIIGGSVYTNIGHVPSNPQTYLKPRFGVKLTREQGTVVILDQDNLTLRVSSYSGAGVHMDDNFANETVDLKNNPLLLALAGRGQLMGLGIAREKVLAPYSSGEMEEYDIYSGIHKFFPIDCVARRSLVGVGLNDAPVGFVWAGQSGLYFLPVDGTGIRILNLNWANFYDGTLLSGDGVTPYVNDTFRAAILSGYDPTYREAWFHLQVTAETPNAIPVTGATNATPISITAVGHGRSTNDRVYISGVLGNTAANGTWIITKTGTDTFTLNTSVGNGAYTSGGTVIDTEYLNFRFNFDTNKWSVRKLRIGSPGNKPVTHFSRNKDNSMTIGYSEALLKYPNRDSSLLFYEDDVIVTTDGSGNITGKTSRGNGIETLLRINLGRLYSLIPNSVLTEILIDHSGAASGNGDRITLNMYFDGESTASDSTAFPVNFKCPPVLVSSTIGEVEKAQFEVLLPVGSLVNFQRLELKKLQIGYLIKKRFGNN